MDLSSVTADRSYKVAARFRGAAKRPATAGAIDMGARREAPPSPAPASASAIDERQLALNELVQFESEGFVALLLEGFTVVDTIDMIMDHGEFLKFWCRYRAATTAAPSSSSPIPLGVRFADASQVVLAILTPADPVLDAMHAAIRRLHGNTKWLEVATSPHEQNKNPLWFMDDPKVPADVAEGLLSSMRAVVALHMLDVHLLMELPEHLSVELAQALVDSLRGYLRLLASVPEASSAVPEAVVPESERLDLPALAKRQQTVLATVDELSATF